MMSILFSSEDGWIVSHLDYLHSIYESVEDDHKVVKLEFNDAFFKVNSRYLRQNQVDKCKDGVKPTAARVRNKRKYADTLPQSILEQNAIIKESSEKLLQAAGDLNLFTSIVSQDNNEESRLESNKFHSSTTLDSALNYKGKNERATAVTATFQNEKYVFPKCCQFICKDIRQPSVELPGDNDLILLDPPWWNKSIRRKKKKKSENSGYEMLYNEELSKIPIASLLKPGSGIVAIWCTNAPSHEKSILEEMLPAWGLTFKAKWFWLKITQNGYPICDFSDSHGKQPYEQIIFGASNSNINFPDKKLLISVPSAVHSHKPPLTEILKPYLPEQPKCVEIFARYLLPGWTSWGLEVLKFQRLSLFSSSPTDVEENRKC